MDQKEIFETYESQVRSYCRNFPTVFKSAKGSVVTDCDGNDFIDFFDGAGALNYGHNNPYIKSKVIEYLEGDGIMHWLDMMTAPKAELIQFMEEKILKPRGLDYKIMFPGPTGTNTNEAAFKVARKYTGRPDIWAFMGSFHGMTLGALAATTDRNDRKGAGVPLPYAHFMPTPYQFPGLDVINYMQTLLDDDHSGYEKPAAIIIETTQAEGGIYTFSNEFLQQLREFCTKNDIVLITDDVQVGCCRTGSFFSFERAGIKPDIVTMSKSIGGIGLPLALTLVNPKMDCLNPGEHNGTFRGNQLAFVASKASLEFMLNEHVEDGVREREAVIKKFLEEKVARKGVEIRGIGCIWAVDLGCSRLSKAVLDECFRNGLILERAGRDDSCVKIMPSLVIPMDLLEKGLEIVKKAVDKVMDEEEAK
jgi:diaminobutyrate-2-oxoglutarate transaminase